jgi:ATP-dependent DNA helicase RecQ
LAHAKLDALLALCESATCRRQRLLAYLGEASEPCGNCDICLSPPQTWDGTQAARKALSCAYRTGQRFGAGHLCDVLLGRESERVRQWRHDQVSTYGIGKELGEKEWRAVFRQLIALGMLEVDHGGFGALRLSEASRPVLRGTQRVMLRKQAEGRPARTRIAAPAAGLDSAGNALWERLRAWRSETAKAHRVPAYVILHDATLLEIVRACPGSLARLQSVPGIGTAKLERHGHALLEICRTHAAEHGLTAQEDAAAPVADAAGPVADGYR